jgi:deoxyribodipyrimidine photo-lyase
MQTGYTGINTIRIYNPIKQSQDHDPDGAFIKMWIPELVHIPTPYLHEPWNIPPLEKQMMGYQTGSYPEQPVVSLQQARKRASDELYAMRKSAAVRGEGSRLLHRHVNPGPRKS